MNVRRLIAGLSAAVAGSAIAIAGTRMAWYEIHEQGRSVSIPGLGDTVIQKVPRVITGGDVASWTTPLAVLMLLAALLATLTARRVRRIALVLVAVGAPVLVFAWMVLGPARVVDQLPPDAGTAVTSTVQNEVGSLLTGAGALIAGVGAIVAWPAAGAPRLGMPETAPEEQAPQG